MYRHFFKRFFDFVFSFVGFLIILPLFILVTFLLIFANNGTPFFLQRRPGKNNKIFKVIKFKTMNDKRDSQGKLLPDANRLTKLGIFIRKTSLDEIPQLINVIKGDMSLIGPRPLLEEYLSLYDKIQIRRHEVRPGITGWAQVNGRNSLSWQEKFRMDVWYVDNISLILDIKILAFTFIKVIKKEGVSSSTSKTMEKFEGN